MRTQAREARPARERRRRQGPQRLYAFAIASRDEIGEAGRRRRTAASWQSFNQGGDQGRLLHRMARVHLVLEGYTRLSQLPPPTQIDLRTLVPLDMAAIERSVEKTGRCLVVMEAPRTSGFASELVTLVQERCFYHLEAPVERVTGWDTPYPHAYEWAYFPGPKRLKRALEKVMSE